MTQCRHLRTFEQSRHIKDILVLLSHQWYQLLLALQEQQYLTDSVLAQDKLPSPPMDFSYVGYLGNFASGFDIFKCNSLQKYDPFRKIWVTFSQVLGCEQNSIELFPPTSRSCRTLLLMLRKVHRQVPLKTLQELTKLWGLEKGRKEKRKPKMFYSHF